MKCSWIASRIITVSPFTFMAIEKTGVVDAIGIENTSGDVILTIADHLPWDGDETQHLEMLQEKINTYLRFIGSGELLKAYPAAHGKRAIISLVGRCQPSPSGMRFLAAARKTLEGGGIGFRFEHYAGNSATVG